MFCPKCSYPQSSENLLFCSRCGFALEEVRELVEQENKDVNDTGKSASKSLLPKQKDISIGAGLMFAGGLVAIIWAFVIGTSPMDVLLPQAFFILGFTLAFVLLFFHPAIQMLHKVFSSDTEQKNQLSSQQNGINLGAILMFIGTLKALLLATFMQPESRAVSTLLFMTGGFVVLLFVRWIVEAVYQLLFKGESSEDVLLTHITDDSTEQLETAPLKNALPSAHSIPVDDYIPPRRENTEIVQPSVTEDTTKSLDKK